MTKDGVVEEFFKDGTLSSVGKYRNGEKIGEWKWYRENGKLMQSGSFDDEKRAAKWKRYHPNGSL
jgi:antitoxin component YwqK of YwqJK toxin-antitoxin module